jgi:hypothetical protein
VVQTTRWGGMNNILAEHKRTIQILALSFSIYNKQQDGG